MWELKLKSTAGKMLLLVTVGSHEGSYASDLMTNRYLQLIALLQFSKSMSCRCSLVDMALCPYVLPVRVSPCQSVCELSALQEFEHWTGQNLIG